MKYILFLLLFNSISIVWAQRVGGFNITVYNKTDIDIERLEIFPSLERGSENVLSRDITRGFSASVKVPTQWQDKCVFSILAADEEGGAYAIDNINLCNNGRRIEITPEDKKGANRDSNGNNERVESGIGISIGRNRQQTRTEVMEEEDTPASIDLEDLVNVIRRERANDQREYERRSRTENANRRNQEDAESSDNSVNIPISSGFLSRQIVNKGTGAVQKLFVVPARRDSSLGWGENLLAAEMLSNQNFKTIIASGDGCYYDIKAESLANEPLFKQNINLCHKDEVVLETSDFKPRADLLSAIFDNRTGKIIEAFYFKPAGTIGWGENILGRLDKSQDGRFINLLFPKVEKDLCFFDVKVVSGRNSIVLEKLNLCENAVTVLRNP